ncbi:MAG: glycosyltransferase [Candidatus Doudnabacteria bacterium]|nr:glycosyltransferase [Candidatus Doudnabacteria bacterium]
MEILKKRDEIKDFLKIPKISRFIVFLHAGLAIYYSWALAFWFPSENPILFALLLIGEIFHLWQALTYGYTVWYLNDTNQTRLVTTAPKEALFFPAVDVFITVAGEPLEIVEETIQAAIKIDYPKFKVFLLNDGYILKKENWKNTISLAAKYKIRCITRKFSGGAKAGNINNALKLTKSPLVAILDADHIPHEDFLKKTVPHFYDEKVGFVQSPQFYRNHDLNEVTRAAWEQQAVFFGAISISKNQTNSATMCGTNMVIKRDALLSVGGICQTNIAEDFLTGLFMHEKGWKSVYVPEVLAEGLAPEDIMSFSKQHFRWARGSLEVIFTYNPIWRHGLSFKQKLQYLSSASYFLSGVVVLLNAALPIFVLFTGMRPLEMTTMDLLAIFLPYMVLTIYVLQVSTNYSVSFRAIAFAVSSFWIQVKALNAVICGQKSKFSVTSKKKLEGNFLSVIIPHLTYVCLAIWSIYTGISREGWSASVMSNVAWIFFNLSMFAPFIAAALPKFNFFEKPIEQLKTAA